MIFTHFLLRIVDIAENWSPDAAGSVLPPNIVPSLRKVMTPDGYLTFERFCAGLKISILRHSAQRHRQADNDSSNEVEEYSGSGEALTSPLSRTNSLPNLYSCGSPSDSSAQSDSSNVSSHHEANSLNGYDCESIKMQNGNAHNEALNRMYGPPKPPRDPNRLTATNLPKLGDDSLTAASRNIAGSTSSLPAATSEKPQFIWKAPPPPYIPQSHFEIVNRGNKNSSLGKNDLVSLKNTKTTQLFLN